MNVVVFTVTTHKRPKPSQADQALEAGTSDQDDQTPPITEQCLFEEIQSLRQERDAAKEVKSCSLTASSVDSDDTKCKMMTGVSWEVFLFLFSFLHTNTRATKISPKDQLFITLVKLRHNLSFDFIAHITGACKTTVITMFWTWMDLMYVNLAFLIKYQDRDHIFSIIPPVFKAKFPRLTAIIDCFEIFIDAPKALKSRAQVYSSYKRHTTVKLFISCSPVGHINFVSRAWGGRASDIHIVRESGFINPALHMPGDQILADRGFTLVDDFASVCGAQLILPPFTKNKKQLSAEEVERARTISSVRIHIERVIGLVKNRYTILKGPVPIRCVKSQADEKKQEQYSSIDKIIKVCAALVNLGDSIVFKE